MNFPKFNLHINVLAHHFKHYQYFADIYYYMCMRILNLDELLGSIVSVNFRQFVVARSRRSASKNMTQIRRIQNLCAYQKNNKRSIPLHNSTCTCVRVDVQADLTQAPLDQCRDISCILFFVSCVSFCEGRINSHYRESSEWRVVLAIRRSLPRRLIYVFFLMLR